ncbi:MAG: VIT domain-containing protein [Anaerolineaceae bacterium]|nr:VIT domain-containing protein [Anaerolineaceae bacterium]
MKTRLIFTIVFCLTLLAVAFNPAQADGILIPTACPMDGGCPIPPICLPGRCPPPLPRPISQLVIRYHHVDVKINDQVAVTHVDQVFYNPNSWQIEGEYVFPLPADAAVTNFTLWVDGKPVEGKVLDAKQASQTYQDMVNQLRDPALLEYIGRGAVEAYIYPIPPQGERRIELEYTQALPVDNGLVKYNYPLDTEKFSSLPIQSVSVTVEISSTQPIQTVYSPTHQVSVDRKDSTHATVSYVGSNILLDTNYSLYYSTGQTEAFHLLSYRDPADPSDPDGFFMVLLAPRPDQTVKPIPKDVLLVLDKSGSMDGEKFRQAQTALKYILKNLNSDDRFFLLSFSSDTQVYATDLSPASAASDASNWVDQQSAEGSTDINRALLEAAAVADPERPTYLIFLTDGLPTVGELDSQQILKNFASAAPANLKLFAFGVGYDVDTVLLDSLSQAHHGSSTYVKPGDQIDEVLSSFYQKISSPVMTDLKLDFGTMATYDVYPNPLPDLFTGSQVVVVGRYRAGGTADVVVHGKVDNEPQDLSYPQQNFTTDSRTSTDSLATLPRLWATRKIGYLLNQVRLQGPDQETINQIVHLSILYGIVTPYTSYLVTEPSVLGADNQSRLAQGTFNNMMAAPAAPVSGQAAVNKAAGEGAMSQADVPAQVQDNNTQTIQTVGARTFVLTGSVWTDTAYDPNRMKTQKVAFLSADYFKLAESRPDVAAAMALGQQVIVMVDRQAYEVVSQGGGTQPIVVPTVLAETLTSTPRASKSPSSTATPVPSPVKLSTQPVDRATTSPLTPIYVGIAVVVLLVAIFLKKVL